MNDFNAADTDDRPTQSSATGLKVGIAHYPEGAGHATRMLGVGRAFEKRGAELAIAGGGPGTMFVRANGYEPYEPTLVDYIGDFQDGGSLLRVLTRSVPRSGKRVFDYVRWLRRESPDFLVTDDMFAAMAAPLAGIPLYFVTHNAPGFYEERVETVFTSLLTKMQHVCSEAFYYPAVWREHPVDPAGVVRVPPIALDEPVENVPSIDVLLVPSHYSRGFDDLASDLEASGNVVTLVGGPEWEPVPSMVPYMRHASVVVCSGYSAVMEAAVAHTPCVIFPFTDEQRGVARVIETHTDRGFRIANSQDAVVDAVASPPAPPNATNGTNVIAERTLADHGESASN